MPSLRRRSTPASPPSPTDSGGIHKTRTLSTIIAAVIPTLALIYFCVLCLVYRYGKQHPKPLNKKSGVRLQRYGPVVYTFVVFSGLAEIALATWLLLQFQFNNNSPNLGTRVGTRFLLFTAYWTTLTAGTYALLFLHPKWSQYPVVSIGGQAAWTFITWIFWVSSAAILNAALPQLLAGGTCIGLVYCGQIQTLFALAVLEILMLTLGMLVIMWLAWQSTRNILRPAA